MATEVATRRGALTTVEIAEGRALCERLALTPKLSAEEATALQSTVMRLSVPATEAWVRGRIATLLSHYFQVDRPEELDIAIADDWIAAIMADPCPPAWALNAACVAWISGPDARRRPLPGDIRQLAFERMPWLISARLRLKIHADPERWAFTGMAKQLEAMTPEEPVNEESRRRYASILADLAKSLEAKALES